MLQYIQIMQQLGFHGGISAHGERKLPLWPGQAPGALNQLAAQGTELLEAPQWRAFLSGISFLSVAEHLHFPIEIVRQHGREQVDLVAGLFASGDVVHLCLRLEFGEDTFLSTASIVEAQCLLGGEWLVGDDHLEVITVFVGDKQVQLDCALNLLAVLGSDKYESVSVIPTRWFPVRFEKAPLSVQATPALSILDQCLEIAKAFERYADGKLNPFRVQR